VGEPVCEVRVMADLLAAWIASFPRDLCWARPCPVCGSHCTLTRAYNHASMHLGGACA
jgi:hypothetical protein